MPLAEKNLRYTYQDYLTWDNDERWELIDGVPYNMSPAPVLRHQEILVNLSTTLFASLKGKQPCRLYVAPCDVVLSQSDVVQPDLFVVCDEKKRTEKNVQGAPDVIFEILSLASVKKDRLYKRSLYESHGVKEYILIDPDGLYAERYTLGADGAYGKSDIFGETDEMPLSSLPSITIPLGEIFDVKKEP